MMSENSENVSILNATLSRPGSNAKHDHITSRIANSIFLDLEQISDPLSPYSLMMPPEDYFKYIM